MCQGADENADVLVKARLAVCNGIYQAEIVQFFTKRHRETHPCVKTPREPPMS